MQLLPDLHHVVRVFSVGTSVQRVISQHWPDIALGDAQKRLLDSFFVHIGYSLYAHRLSFNVYFLSPSLPVFPFFPFLILRQQFVS